LSPIRILGSALSLLNGAWAAYIAYYHANTLQPCSHSGCPGAPGFGISSPELQGALLVIGVILAIDALVSFVGIRASFIIGAILSASVLAIVAVLWGTYSGTDSAVALVLSVLALVVDAVASRPSQGLSEKDSPLNLPVFG